MKLVLDASVGLKTVLPETDSDKAETLIPGLPLKFIAPHETLT